MILNRAMPKTMLAPLCLLALAACSKPAAEAPAAAAPAAEAAAAAPAAPAAAAEPALSDKLTSGATITGEPIPGRIVISHAKARETKIAGVTGAGFLDIRNIGGDDDRLLSASSPVAKSVEIHEMSMDGGVMRMRALKELVIPAGKTVSLSPGGTHLMLIGTQAPLKAGDSIRVDLQFEKAGRATVALQVEPLEAGDDSHAAH